MPGSAPPIASTSTYTKAVRDGKLLIIPGMTLLPPTWFPPQHHPVYNSQQAHWSGMWQHTCKLGPVAVRDLIEAPGGGV